jgi:Immunity protein Imm1
VIAIWQTATGSTPASEQLLTVRRLHGLLGRLGERAAGGEPHTVRLFTGPSLPRHSHSSLPQLARRHQEPELAVVVGAPRTLLLWDSPAAGQLISTAPAAPPPGRVSRLFCFHHAGKPCCVPSSSLMAWDDAWPAIATFITSGGLRPAFITWRHWPPASHAVPARRAS